MSKVSFRKIRLNPANRQRLAQINQIVNEYRRQGYVLTLRQLYYQLVSRDIIPNRVEEYKKLSKILTEGRMAGMVDWDAIEDRLRQVEVPSSWTSPHDIMKSVVNSWAMPLQQGQENYIEVWVEKDALSGVLSRVTRPYHIPIMVNRGYSSVSAIYDSYRRFARELKAGKKVIILYMGDFDPSGVDMIRDVYDRPLEMLLAHAVHIADGYDPDSMYEDLYYKWYGDPRAITNGDDNEDYAMDGEFFDPYKAYILDRFKVEPIALTRDQIEEHEPPPNPAKITDPRAGDFISKYGEHSWEVDALLPEVLDAILREAIESRIDMGKYEAMTELQEEHRETLKKLKAKAPGVDGLTEEDKETTDEDDSDEDDDDE